MPGARSLRAAPLPPSDHAKVAATLDVMVAEPSLPAQVAGCEEAADEARFCCKSIWTIAVLVHPLVVVAVIV